MITVEEFNKFRIAFYKKEDGQRFGQAFCNEFDITDSVVFYEKNNTQAEHLIQRYIG